MYVDYDDREPLTRCPMARTREAASTSLVSSGSPMVASRPQGRLPSGAHRSATTACTRLEESGDYWIASCGRSAGELANAALERGAGRQPIDASHPAVAVIGVPANRLQDAVLPRHLRHPARLLGELLLADANTIAFARPLVGRGRG